MIGEVVYRECYAYYKGGLRGIYMTRYMTGLERFDITRFSTSKALSPRSAAVCIYHQSPAEDWEVVSRYGYPVTETLPVIYKVYQPISHQNKSELEYIRLASLHP